MKKMLCTLLAIVLLACVLPMSVSANEYDDAALQAHGEALLHETLEVLRNEWTMHYGFRGDVLSFNGEWLAHTWGTQRAVFLYSRESRYTFNRNYRLRFAFLGSHWLFRLLDLNLDELELEVTGNTTVRFEGYRGEYELGEWVREFRFFYCPDGNLIRLEGRTVHTRGTAVDSFHINSFEPVAQRNFFNTRLTIRLPGTWYNTIMFLMMPFNIVFVMFWNIVDAIRR
ncbi:MAG: hypothetical protein FWD06_01995 [Oscillospiraceae bacterium]|nr:hypothetical protein [Oscillospiraceae bacterium]